MRSQVSDYWKYILHLYSPSPSSLLTWRFLCPTIIFSPIKAEPSPPSPAGMIPNYGKFSWKDLCSRSPSCVDCNAFAPFIIRALNLVKDLVLPICARTTMFADVKAVTKGAMVCLDLSRSHTKTNAHKAVRNCCFLR